MIIEVVGGLNLKVYGGRKMGVDLILKKDGKYVGSFGRSYHFMPLEFDYAALDIEVGKIETSLKETILPLIAYSPKDNKELNEILNDVNEQLEYYIEEMQRIGQRFLISYLLEDEGITVEED